MGLLKKMSIDINIVSGSFLELFLYQKALIDFR